ncbi:putative transcriptional regulatory protein TBS1 [Ceratocystis fimbriata CBS 114723]|uniref:Putative transcriptional regulatory protein TBS1 n=1 Tax=Ceratocystis fimbriata CBS 114723 TaxID=1035309 RepID=A0A2C5XH25_9PEZI|nr:putative transcriptional regulatory protein TBS1 [Ceratocystis fimbriata CBS 114723]
MSTTLMVCPYQNIPPPTGTEASVMTKPNFDYGAHSQGSMTSPYSPDSSISQQSGERRRNKLGYHRTSVACGHCRKRKIRCILATDSNGKCVNCIRLKKDCTFYPVDQAPPDSRGKQGTSSQSSASSRGSSTKTTQSKYSSTGIPLRAMAPSTAEQTLNSSTAFDYTPPPIAIFDTAWRGFADEGLVSSPSPYQIQHADSWPTSSATAGASEASWYTQDALTRGSSFNSLDANFSFDRKSSSVSDYQTSIGGIPLSSPVYEQPWQDPYPYGTRHSNAQFNQWVGFSNHSPATTATATTGTTTTSDNTQQKLDATGMQYLQSGSTT